MANPPVKDDHESDVTSSSDKALDFDDDTLRGEDLLTKIVPWVQ